MTPTPLTAAFPKLAAAIDAERPLISAALLDIRITDIRDNTVVADVINEHSFTILTSSSQQCYLDTALSNHMGHAATFLFNLAFDKQELPLQSNTGPKRTSNTLTFTERNQLQQWMQQPANTDLVALDSDTVAAKQASTDLALAITPGNIASMRKILGVEKIKPAKAAMVPAHDIDLLALYARVEQHHLQLDPIAGISIAEVLTNLRDDLHALEKRFALESANN